jgi:hypothetical protein
MNCSQMPKRGCMRVRCGGEQVTAHVVPGVDSSEVIEGGGSRGRYHREGPWSGI